MKNRCPALMFACASIALASSNVDAQNIQIMPFTTFDFIGNQSGVANGSPANFWPEQNYEGGGGGDGITTQDGIGIAQSDAAGRNPDVVLLELGANDVFAGIAPGQSETNLEEIVQAFAANPNVVILIATPTKFIPDPSLPKQQQNQERNALARVDGIIGKVVSVERKAGVNINQVSLGGYSAKTDTSDGTHPNIKGEQYIAKQFFLALKRAKVI
jgi:lysophospholipase L1-like esterase